MVPGAGLGRRPKVWELWAGLEVEGEGTNGGLPGPQAPGRGSQIQRGTHTKKTCPLCQVQAAGLR